MSVTTDRPIFFQDMQRIGACDSIYPRLSALTRGASPEMAEGMAVRTEEKEEVMIFKNGSDVFTAEGNHVGGINGVVIDPGNDEVTHLIVKQGFLFTEDKVLPVAWVGETHEDRITLRPDIVDLDGLPKFEETHYVPRHEDDLAGSDGTHAYPGVIPVYPYPHYGLGAWPIHAVEVNDGMQKRVQQNIPAETEALKAGATVVSADGEHVGEVEGVLMDEQANRVSHFVIEEGFFFKNRKLVPVSWVKTVAQDEIYLGVGSRTLDNLPEYQP
jgi:uncharacterized protein YrrD